MKNQIEIVWTKAQEISQEIQKEQTESQKKALQEFKESSHEMTDARDLIYYLEATGTEEKNIFDLLQYANNLSPLITGPLQAGCTLDEILDVDPYIKPEEDEETPPDIELLNGKVTVFFEQPFSEDKYYIHVGDACSFGYTYPDPEETQLFTLEECKKIEHSNFINFATDKGIYTNK